MRDRGGLRFLDVLVDIETFASEGYGIVFYSYQWLSWTHKGPNVVQLECMNSAVRHYSEHSGMPTGRIYIWLDILAIPQSNREVQQLAVDSLYVYASAVTALIIIAPDSVHEQTKAEAGIESYKSRV